MPVSGDRVGEYVFDTQIGAGTFGEVWRARHHVWAERLVAIKVPTDPEYVRALQHEGTAVHGLDHPNIVTAINFDPYATPPYLAMEYVPGVSLRGLMSQRPAGRLDFREAAQILTQILSALSHAHSRGIIHRDIKPENVLIHEKAIKEGFAERGVVKLTDFGLGQQARQYAANSIAYTASIQRGSDIAGTLAYMSPEQRSGMSLDVRSDLYSCGVMLFEMLTGERPAGTELPSDLNPAVPKPIDDVFKRSYARLAVRYATAEDFAHDLTKAVNLTNQTPPPLPTTPPPLPGGRAPGSPGTAGVTRQASSTTTSCPKCNFRVSSQDQFCMSCGYQLVDRVRRCGSCGAYPHPDDHFCLICGRDLPTATGNPPANGSHYVR